MLRVPKSFYLSLKTANDCMLPIEIGCGKIWKTPRGPKGEKRFADVGARAALIAKIATGEVEEIGRDPQNPSGSLTTLRSGSPIASSLPAMAKRLILKRSRARLARTLTMRSWSRFTARPLTAPRGAIRQPRAPKSHDADAHAPVHSADQCLLKEGREPRLRRRASHDVLQFRPRSFEAAHVARYGRWHEQDALGGFGYRGIVGGRRAEGD